MKKTIFSCWFCPLLFAWSSAPAVDAGVNLDFTSQASSNVYLDKSAEWDLVLKPALEASLDFAGYWSAGYGGELNAFARHQDMLSHWHEVFIFANPAWGREGENEATIEASVQTLRNQPAFSALNLLQPGLMGNIVLEPSGWLRWRLELRGAWRHFYDDQESSSVDTWTETEFAFTLPSRTTISPRVAYGLRLFTRQVGGSGAGGSADRQDQQLVAGARVSQAITKSCGLHVDYSFLLAVGDSGILQRKLTEAQFTYLGEEFLFGGHRASATLKWVLLEAAILWVGARYEKRDWAGWPALDANGTLTGEERSDTRVGPRLAFEYRLARSAGWLPELKLAAEYQFLRQWSNHDWYDTSAHLGGISLWGSW